MHAEFVAGMLSGALSTSICHPLDVVRTIFQVHDGRQSRDYLPTKPTRILALRSFFQQSIQVEGWRIFYRGFAIHLTASTISWGTYFALYAWFKSQTRASDPNPTSFLIKHFVSSWLAGMGTIALTNPFWLVKTRLCLQPSTHSDAPYRNARHALYSIVSAEGVSGLFKGLGIGLVGTIHGGIQFASYDLLKSHLSDPSSPNTLTILSISSLSKIIAILTTYPCQVIRSRLQDRRGDSTGQAYTNSIDVIRRIFIHEGWRGLYKGLGFSILRVLPSTWITLVTYESILSHIQFTLLSA